MPESRDTPPTNPFGALRQRARTAADKSQERCDLCNETVAPEHRHLLDISSRSVLCVCTACKILFDRPAAGRGMRRLIPTRYLALQDFEMSDRMWETLRIPVNMAFFTYSTTAERVMALYPSPAGPTESLLTLETWTELEERNPVLEEMEPDVEALLVNRVRGAAEYYLVPIDECYKLVGMIRAYWKGLSGGREVWRQIDDFFVALRMRAGHSGGDDA